MRLPTVVVAVFLLIVGTENYASRGLLIRECLHSLEQPEKSRVKKLYSMARLYFGRQYEPLANSATQVREEIRLFDYPLSIERIPESKSHAIITPCRPTIYFHGWADNKNSAKILKHYCDVLPGEIITFNFPDSHGIRSLCRNSNFGQLPDVLVGIYVLKVVYTTLNPEGFDLYGVSRGGAVIINMLAVLNDTTGKYDADLQRIGITQSLRQELTKLIQHGCIILDCPLTDLKVALKHKMPKLDPRKAQKLVSKITRYNPDGLEAIDSIEFLKGLKLNILIHFQHNDRVVTNVNDAALYQRLIMHNPESTYVVLGNDGGHVHTHKALRNAIHTFRRIHGGSYYQHYDDNYQITQQPLVKTTHLNSGVLLQPYEAVEQCIAEYYTQCRSGLIN